ncbi:hypothetical protein [Streptomyces sp. RP5T]|uniref:hypothetical protein n=1 Tax=Streptomyces sp. RP5T TaxID=2490848 RepID=UPI000F654C8F|nr:hypothetical protein [Streptomyces sp. RP5T]RRR76495.1 hypothetical protein EHS43_30550 [Streptomyces sp. RP5T]
MRPLVPRGLLLPSLICAAFVLGPVGTATAAVDAGRGALDHGVARTATVRTTDEAGSLKDHLDALDRAEHDSVLRPLLDAVTGIPALEGERLDASEAAGHAKAVAAANAEVREELRELSGSGTGRSAAADPVSDLLDSLQATIDDLLESLTSLDVGGVLGAVTDLLGSVTGAVTGLLGGGLPSIPPAD